jgi:hypothetical protein
MLTEKEYKALEVLSARLAESVLMDWDKEEQVKLAKEVAIKCHSIFNDKESREFVSLVKRMREAQNRVDMLAGGEDIEFVDMLCIEQREAEREVDEYLKKMEE